MAMTFVIERSATRQCRRLSSKKGDGQKNVALLVFLPFSEQTSEKRAVCASSVPKRCAPKRVACNDTKALSWLHLASEGGGLDGGRLHRLAVERFRVSIFSRILAGAGEVAEWSRRADVLNCLANRGFRPLSHLTAHLQVYVTKILTRNRSTARR